MNYSTEKLSLAEALAAARDTRALRVGPGAINELPVMFREVFGRQEALVVADANTFGLAGDQVQSVCADGHVRLLKPLIFHQPDLYAESRFVEELEIALRLHRGIPIAIGSGTLNDLTKLASHRTGRQYVCVATAASMDGYTAYGASITHLGSKQTFDCPAPAAVVADLDLISQAPAEMTSWGYADLLAKITAGADWILADALGVEPIDKTSWNIVQGGLREAIADPAGVRKGNVNAVGRLVEGLMLGGFAMQAARSSRPASGAEHQFSHLWDMQHHTYNGAAPSHGLKVGIGTIAVTTLYEKLLSMPLEKLNVARACAQWPSREKFLARARELFSDPDLLAVAEREILAKYIEPAPLRDQLNTLQRLWPEVREHLRHQLIELGELKRMLDAAGARTQPEHIGITPERLRASFEQAFFIRRRFTVLDVAVRAGVLGECLEEIFGRIGR